MQRILAPLLPKLECVSTFWSFRKVPHNRSTLDREWGGICCVEHHFVVGSETFCIKKYSKMHTINKPFMLHEKRELNCWLWVGLQAKSLHPVRVVIFSPCPSHTTDATLAVARGWSRGRRSSTEGRWTMLTQTVLHHAVPETKLCKHFCALCRPMCSAATTVLLEPHRRLHVLLCSLCVCVCVVCVCVTNVRQAVIQRISHQTVQL